MSGFCHQGSKGKLSGSDRDCYQTGWRCLYVHTRMYLIANLCEGSGGGCWMLKEVGEGGKEDRQAASGSFTSNQLLQPACAVLMWAFLASSPPLTHR